MAPALSRNPLAGVLVCGKTITLISPGLARIWNVFLGFVDRRGCRARGLVIRRGEGT